MKVWKIKYMVPDGEEFEARVAAQTLELGLKAVVGYAKTLDHKSFEFISAVIESYLDN